MDGPRFQQEGEGERGTLVATKADEWGMRADVAKDTEKMGTDTRTITIGIENARTRTTTADTRTLATTLETATRQ